MITIATLLEMKANKETETTWNWLEAECGLMGVKLTPTPHFSWQVAENYDFPEIESRLQKRCSEIDPFIVKGVGLGIFTSKEPVIYSLLVKNQQLLKFHLDLWNELLPFTVEMNPLYSPPQWIPHVTLAYKDITPEKLACGIKSLAFREIEMEISVTNLAILYQEDEDLGIRSKYCFGKSI